MEFKDYEKYKWFVTSSGKLVVGGKSAEQNESLLKKLKSQKEDFMIMHTAEPGSPFSAILSSPKSITQSDMQECAIFTASFSRAWRQEKKKINVDVFQLSNLFKSNSMKTGTWGVKKLTKRISAPLSLVLTTQKGKLRAVPKSTLKSSIPLLIISPGKTDKIILAPKIQDLLNNKFTKDEILSALPAGGSKIQK